MAEPETRYIRAADGMRIAYEFIEGRDPVVLDSPVHGYQFDVAEQIPSWVEYREQLRGDHAWAMLTYRGAGLSGRFEGEVTVDDFVLDLDAVVRDLGQRPLVVVATASGIGPAVDYVAGHPERVRGLLLQGASRQAFDPQMLALFREDLERGLYVAARWMYDWDSELAIRPLVQRWMRGLSETSYWESVRAYEDWGLSSERLARVGVPVALTGPVELRDEIAELAADLADVRVAIDEIGPVLNAPSGRRVRELIEPWLLRAVRSVTVPGDPYGVRGWSAGPDGAPARRGSVGGRRSRECSDRGVTVDHVRDRREPCPSDPRTDRTTQPDRGRAVGRGAWSDGVAPTRVGPGVCADLHRRPLRKDVLIARGQVSPDGRR